MTVSRKSATTSRSTPKKPRDVQTTGITAVGTPNRTERNSKPAIKQESEELGEVENAETPKPSKRKRRLGEVEETTVVEETSSKSPKRYRATKTKKGDTISRVSTPRIKQEATLRVEEEVDEGTEAISEKDNKKTKRKGKQGGSQKIQASKDTAKKSAAHKSKETLDKQTLTSSGKNKKKAKVKVEEEVAEDGVKKLKRKRKTKEEREAENMPLAARTSGLRMFLGAHVSGAKGVHNSVTNAQHIGGNAFAMFLKSQRKWENPPLQDDHRDQFIAFCSAHKYDAACHVLPHGSYLVNLAQEDPDKANQAYNAFLDDLLRCDALGIKLYNFHPGWTGSASRPSAIGRIASALNRALTVTTTVTPVLETMAGSGNVIGSTFEDLRDIITLVDDKARIGVCMDTCHIFAAGYDLCSPKAFKSTIDEFDGVVGIKYLRALHLNDSKAPLGSHRDLHQNIGLGFLGLRAFHNVMNEKRFEGLPLILETPFDKKDENGKDGEDKGIWAGEIKLLEGLIGTDADSGDFQTMQKELADKGADEREQYQEAFERKKEKEMKKEKGQTKLKFAKKKLKEESDLSSSE